MSPRPPKPNIVKARNDILSACSIHFSKRKKKLFSEEKKNNILFRAGNPFSLI